ncbi:MAG: hypothetical protein GXP49_18625 [Deltaproteobacteria bacterium]|nr:hypothetical protein [Deltaproteobacteria bacterium]
MTPRFEVRNVSDPDGDVVVYNFEVYPGRGNVGPLVESGDVKEGKGGITTWQGDETLEFGKSYTWRARAKDSHGAAGPWSVYASFSISPGKNSANGCGCGASQSPAGGFSLILFGVALIASRHRFLK